jgi:NhaP-type Na+/H+ or K+/H+ antiporter
MVLVAVGMVLGDGGLRLLRVTAYSEWVKVLAELTLAILLFADASTIGLRDVEDDASLPGRLLGIGLPLTIGTGTILAHAVLGGSWAEAALVAAVLAPTDAALGLAVVTNASVPARVRRVLNIESGLNDGIATPFVVFFLAVVAAEAEHRHWILGGLKEIALAVAFGAALGAVVGSAAGRARQAGWTTPVSDALVVASVALLAYEGAVLIGANGFVAAFVAGILFGSAAGRQFRQATELTEDVGLYASFAVWMIFGAVLAGPVLRSGIHARTILYALLSLTLVRMVPVAVALCGARLRKDTVAFIGWFGPRGLASVVFTLLVIETLHGGARAAQLTTVATWTVLISVFAHGLSSGPLSALYARRLGRATDDLYEFRATTELRTRKRSLLDRTVPVSGPDDQDPDE